MKLLFDQNLSRHLVSQFAVEFPNSRHVTDVGLDTATDREIWEYAGEFSGSDDEALLVLPAIPEPTE